MKDLFDLPTAEDMRKDVMEQAKGDGCTCPVCDQFVKVYKRVISSTMARDLVEMYLMHGDNQWFHIRDTVKKGMTVGGDFSKLQYWGFVAPRRHEKGSEGKRTSGMWLITNKGVEFLRMRMTAPKYAHVYNGECIGFSGDNCYISQCFKNKFDYNTLMERSN